MINKFITKSSLIFFLCLGILSTSVSFFISLLLFLILPISLTIIVFVICLSVCCFVFYKQFYDFKIKLQYFFKEKKMINNTNMPNIKIGDFIKLSETDMLSDSGENIIPLHFEPSKVGLIPIVAIANRPDIKTIELYTAYKDDDIDFISSFYDNKKLNISVFFSIIDVIYTSSKKEVDDWIGNNGHIGQPTFITRDNCQWSRCAYKDTDNHVNVDFVECNIEKSDDSVDKLLLKECLYRRDTNF